MNHLAGPGGWSMASRRLELFPAATGLEIDSTWEPAAADVLPATAEQRSIDRFTGHRLSRRVALVAMAQVAAAAGGLLFLRTRYADRVFPSVHIGDVSTGGMTFDQAAAAVRERAAAVEKNPVVFSFEGQEWRSTFGELGVTTDPDRVLNEAATIGREPDALERLRSTVNMVRQDTWLALPMVFDQSRLEAWFDSIDRDLGLPPHNASLAIQGSKVEISPEQDGTIVDRARATASVMESLTELQPLSAELPVSGMSAAVRTDDLISARDALRAAMSNPIQVSHGAGVWTLPANELGAFVTQSIDPNLAGAEAFSIGVDREKLAAWLGERFEARINRDPADAIVGWNGERLVSVEQSVDGETLQPDALATLVGESFLGDHRVVVAPVTITKPKIDSNNLDALGVVRMIGTGSSNYEGSTVDRATNVETGAALLNGALVRPRGEFSFNNAIGLIDKSKGFVDAQVIDGESIGQDVGGGICQVSTTVFRAAYFGGFPIGDWWPHRFRIAFYEFEGWPPGLDASILQPEEDPSTWADFTFQNPTDSWLLVESWTNGIDVTVNIYGADVDWDVQSFGPTFGEKTQVLKDVEVVDDKLEPGTIKMNQEAGYGQEVAHYRKVFDGDKNILWEGNFYTRFFPKGNVWNVSEDMKGKSPADPDRVLTPVIQDKPSQSAAREFEPGVTPPSDWTPVTDTLANDNEGGTWQDPAADATWQDPAADTGWQDPNAATTWEDAGTTETAWQDPAAAETWQDPAASSDEDPLATADQDQGG